MRDGFIVHEKTLKQMARLDPEDVGYLMNCLAEYYYTGAVDVDQVAEVSVAVAVILDDAIERMDSDADAYSKSIEQKRKAAEKRWSEKGMQTDAEGMRENAEPMRENAEPMRNDAEHMRNDAEPMRNDADGMRTVCGEDAGNAVSVSVSDSVSVSKEKTALKSSKKEKFARPSLEEVRAYCIERGNTVDPEAFIAFYDSNGWKVGNNQMKNWKSAVITWEKRQKDKPVARSGTKFSNFPQRDDQEHRDMVSKIIALNTGG